LDGTYDHSSVGAALGSSKFKRDQHGTLESALSKLISSGTTEPLPIIETIQDEIERNKRNQKHWLRVREVSKIQSERDRASRIWKAL
jgi:hypothetical protein